jgi:hypothetical protein
MTDQRLHYHLPIIPVTTAMMELLQARVSSIEAAISERHRAAREAGTVADVKTLSSTLREIKAQLAAVVANGGEAEPGTCVMCGSDSFKVARYVHGKTFCERCLAKAKKASSTA